jgi:hypothetical protein
MLTYISKEFPWQFNKNWTSDWKWNVNSFRCCSAAEFLIFNLIIFLFVYILLNDVLSDTDDIVSNGGMLGE